MFEEKRTKRQIKKVVEKVKAYNVGTFSDLPKVGEEIYKLCQEYNKHIKTLTKKIVKEIVISTSLKHKKLFLNYQDLKNKVLVLRFETKHRPTEKDCRELSFYEKLLKETDENIENAIKNNDELRITKLRYHNTLALYKNPNYKQIKRSSDSKFDSLTFKQKIEMLDEKTFYNLSIEDIKELYQAIANEYCDNMEIKRIPIIFTSYDRNSTPLGDFITFGNYARVNIKALNEIKELQENGLTSNYLQYRTLVTVIHECRHSFQFASSSNDEKEKYISNAAKINNHYMLRIFYEENPYPENLGAIYKSKIHEMDALDESLKFLLDISKYPFCNAQSLQDVAMYLMPKNYISDNTNITQMIELVKDFGLPTHLSKCIYENMRYLGLTSSKNLVMVNDKINYQLTNEKNVKTLTKEKLHFAFENEKYMREKSFDTLFARNKYVNEYANKQGLTIEECEEHISHMYDDDGYIEINSKNSKELI